MVQDLRPRTIGNQKGGTAKGGQETKDGDKRMTLEIGSRARMEEIRTQAAALTGLSRAGENKSVYMNDPFRSCHV